MRQPRPPLLVLGAVLAALAGLVCVALTVLPLWPGSQTIINDRVVTRAYYATHAAPFTLLATTLLLAVAWGVWRERAWVRRVVLVVWALYVVMAVLVQRSQGGAVPAIVGGLALLACSAWYLYANPRVTAYYAALPGAPAAPSDATPGARRAR